jgi:hypothetical protein
MPKYSIGLIAGLALVSAAAATSMAANGASTVANAPTDRVQLQVGQVAPASPGAAASGQNTGTAPGSGAQVGAQAANEPAPGVSARAAKPVVKTVRTVKVDLPKSIQVGKTATGFVSVMDVTGKTGVPVNGVNVALQEKRTVGKTVTWVDVQSGTTDGSGRMAIAFTGQVNTTWRAAYYPATGKPAYSAQLTTQVYAWVTWGARPDMDVRAKTATSYTLRITADSNPNGHLEYMRKGDKKWTKLKSAKLPANDLITQAISFAKAGTYYVRGASDNTKSNSPGYTTTLTITVR